MGGATGFLALSSRSRWHRVDCCVEMYVSLDKHLMERTRASMVFQMFFFLWGEPRFVGMTFISVGTFFGVRVSGMLKVCFVPCESVAPRGHPFTGI